MRDEDRVKLWDAINAYAITCGGDPSRFVYGNTPRQKAVAEIETLARAVAQAARDECIATVEAKRAEWVHDAVVAGDRRDWNGTNTYEAMDDAAQRLVAAIRSRSAAGGGAT